MIFLEPITTYAVVYKLSVLLPGLDSSREIWDRVLGVNLIGYSNMVQACHPFMKKSKFQKKFQKFIIQFHN